MVSTVKEAGLIVSHDYREHEQAIPLPATLSMELARRLGEGDHGNSISLYSPYPFPWHVEEGGLRDEFAEQAWEHFSTTANNQF